MKKLVLVLICSIVLLCVGCGAEENQKEESLDNKEYSEEITLMHGDGNKEEFQQFIKETEEKLQINIHVVTSPQNADNRHAKISTILSSGDDSVDVIAVNDEMMSEFKSQGYLECLGQYVLNKASQNKEAAKKFLAYVASREGSIAYSQAMYCLPARLDIIEEEDLSVPDMDVMRNYVKNVELKARPFTSYPMEDIKDIGKLFQKYAADEINLDEFCRQVQIIVDETD